MEETVVSRREKKSMKRKRMNVKMEVATESSDRLAPVVGYFPSGYNPENPDEDPPSIRVFRNKWHPNRLELVVSPSDGNVEFVGNSYSGEAAAPQLCDYALGVFDKETQRLKIVSFAANKIFRLEPRVIKDPSADVEASEGVAEESAARRISDLTDLYGTKKNKIKNNLWRSMDQQRTELDPEQLDSHGSDHGINKEAQDDEGVAPRNVPPYDSSAVVPEKAYPLDEIISKTEWDYLSDILEITESGANFSITFWQENDYPCFVYNRIHNLRDIKGYEEKNKLAGILSYITHLLKFWKLAKKSRRSKSQLSSMHIQKIPRVIYQKLLHLFVDPATSVMSTEKEELLIGYILVLTLFADGFRSNPDDIAKDLEMPSVSLKPYLMQLGCKSTPVGKVGTIVTLPVPLQFRESRRRGRPKRR